MACGRILTADGVLSYKKARVPFRTQLEKIYRL